MPYAAGMKRLIWPVLVALVACSGQQTPPPEGAKASAESSAPAPEAAAPTTTADAATTAPEASAAPPAPPRESLLALCNKMCDAVAPKCTKTQLETCRVTCKNYEEMQDACDPVARKAFECARADKDFLFCTNVVPINCAKEFKAVGVCSATGVAPLEESKQAMPDGWARFEAKDAGFSAVMPKGVTASTEGDVKKWAVTASTGASYEVTLRPAPPDKKIDNRYFLKRSRELFGRCADKMKLHAIIEKEGHTSIQFKVVCPEKTQQLGTLHVVGGSKLYTLLLTFPEGAKVDVDPFMYSFEKR
jgi:hypothetical protein